MNWQVKFSLYPYFVCFKLFQCFRKQVANPSDIVKMQRNIKRVKVEKRPIDEEAMNNAFNKVRINLIRSFWGAKIIFSNFPG